MNQAGWNNEKENATFNPECILLSKTILPGFPFQYFLHTLSIPLPSPPLNSTEEYDGITIMLYLREQTLLALSAHQSRCDKRYEKHSSFSKSLSST